MCTNVRWITNKWTHDKILVSCGHCKACLQAKANKRAQRLKNEISSKNLQLFITLTYDRLSCPYVLHEDILNNVYPLPVYRDCSIRRSPVDHLFHRKLETEIIAYDEMPIYDVPLNFLPYLKKTSGGKIGVCLFSDVQDFNKRLKQNLQRIYNCHAKYKVYNTFEYGSKTQRPHIHLQMSIPSSLYKTFKSAIVESWPFADRDRTLSNIQIARDSASYVASYVNCSSYVPRFLEANFPPKHSFSQGMGCGSDSFQLAALQENVRRQNMSYNIKSVKDGVECLVNLPVPKYVINRFFPLFKGYSRLTRDEIFNVLQSTDRICNVYESIKKNEDARMRLLYHYEKFNQREHMINYTLEDMFHIGTMLHNSYERYKRITGKSTYDYAIDFFSVWSCYKNTIYKRFALDDEPEQYRYDNRLSDEQLITPRRLARSNSLIDLYDAKSKSRYVINSALSETYYDV